MDSKKKLQLVVHDFVYGFDTYTEKPGYTWDADLAFADVDPSEHVALVVPGGRAPEYIRNDPDCQRIVARARRGGCLEGGGRRPTRRSRRTSRPSAPPSWTAPGVVDGMMVSARAWPDHPSWMREFMRILAERAPRRAPRNPRRWADRRRIDTVACR